MAVTADIATPFAEELRAAVAAQGRDANGARNGREALRRPQARRVATTVGRGMLAAAHREVAEHSDDVVVISAGICDLLEVKGAERDDLLAAARLHDIGKAAIPRELLEKPGPLTRQEWEVMRSHTEVGAEILSSVAELSGIATLVRHSHERWDGGGYPDGIAGEAIPLGSRIIFCADAFHAIRSDRPYRAGRPAPVALAEIADNSGTQFDARIVQALHDVAHELRLAPAARHRVRRSSRLSVLLLVLALGGGGSAVARSGLLGDPSASAAGPAAPVPGLQCEARGCFGLDGLPPPGGPGNAEVRSDTGEQTGLTDSERSSGGVGNLQGEGGNHVGGQPGQSSSAAPGSSADKPDGAPPGHSPGGLPGNSGNNPHGGPPGLSGADSPGNSGNAPGHDPSGPGNSENAPGHNK